LFGKKLQVNKVHLAVLIEVAEQTGLSNREVNPAADNQYG